MESKNEEIKNVDLKQEEIKNADLKQEELPKETDNNEKITKKEKKKKVKKEKLEKPEEPVVEKTPEEIAIEKFNKMDIRIGTLDEVWKHSDSDKLYCEKINIKYEVREIASGLQKFIPIEEMKGKVIVLANLKPRKLGGFPSNGMVLCASNLEHTIVELMYPEKPDEVENGDRIYLETQEPLPEELAPKLNPKHKIVEFCSEYLKTDDQGYATYKGMKLMARDSYIKCNTLKCANIS